MDESQVTKGGASGAQDGLREPPRGLGAVLRSLGPGMIVAGSVVGSGELIATTKVGGQSGFWLLWLILIGCAIKVFTQVEFGRFSLATGKTTLEGLNELPGPRMGSHVVLWLWCVQALFLLGLLSGILGALGHALTTALPLTDGGSEWVALQGERVRWSLAGAGGVAPDVPEAPLDIHLWALVVVLLTTWLLVVGRFKLVQNLSTVLVCTFTAVTVGTVVLLQGNPEWAVTADELKQGLSFKLPPGDEGSLGTALAAFGMIGIGASELVMYPYWCQEKGYARWTGPREDSESWLRRAQGWMRVMRLDAGVSLVVYTTATVAFFLLGAATLKRVGLEPTNDELIPTLAGMYEPVFGVWAVSVFLMGAVAVLYSTFFVAQASFALLFTDAVKVLGFGGGDAAWIERTRRAFRWVLPTICLGIFILWPRPVMLVLLGGLAQALILPVLGAAALYFRYQRTPKGLAPGKLWDVCLWASCLGFLVVSLKVLTDKLSGL